MKKIEEQRHFLALMARPGDFIFIDISKLEIANGFNPNSIMEIDTFTMYFTEEEIIMAIKNANLADVKYLNGKLVIQDNQKHNPLPVLTKDLYNGFRLDVFLKEYISDKITLNKISNKFRSMVKDIDEQKNFSNLLRNKDINKIMETIFSLPYLIQRRLIIYIIEIDEEKRNENKEKELIRDREKAA